MCSSDLACAHAQATARVSPELDRLIRERRKVDAMIRRGLTHEAAVPTPPEDLLVEVFPLLERIGEEIEKMLGGKGRSEAVEGGKRGGGATETMPSSLADRRAELDRLLRQELERQGIVVTGKDIARVVSSAVGKGLEWAG